MVPTVTNGRQVGASKKKVVTRRPGSSFVRPFSQKGLTVQIALDKAAESSRILVAEFEQRCAVSKLKTLLAPCHGEPAANPR